VIHKPVLPRAHRTTLRATSCARTFVKTTLSPHAIPRRGGQARRAATFAPNDAEIVGWQRIAALQRFQNIVDRIEASYCLICNKSCWPQSNLN
jgi:hypothetical protein